jgi:hypothetical protein
MRMLFAAVAAMLISLTVTQPAEAGRVNGVAGGCARSWAADRK